LSGRLLGEDDAMLSIINGEESIPELKQEAEMVGAVILSEEAQHLGSAVGERDGTCTSTGV
jgi:hypothetical protein